MPLYLIRLQNRTTEKVNTITIGSPCLSEAETDAGKTAKAMNSEIISVARVDTLQVEEHWGNHASKVF